MKGYYKIEFFSDRKTCDYSLIESCMSLKECSNDAKGALSDSKLWTKAYIYYLGDFSNNFQDVRERWKAEIHFNNLLKPVAEIMK